MIEAESASAVTQLDEISETDLKTAFRRMKRRSPDIQFDLVTQTDIPPPPPGWTQAFGRFIGRLVEWLTPVFKLLFWTILAGLGGLIVYAIGSAIWEAFRDRRRTGQSTNGTTEYQPSAAQRRVLLSDADALAEQGRFSEAVHLLLYRSIDDIEQVRPGVIRRSMTAREIGHADEIGPRTRTAFSEIARLVERSFFGGDPLTQTDYQKSRKLYHSLAPEDENVDARDRELNDWVSA